MNDETVIHLVETSLRESARLKLQVIEQCGKEVTTAGRRIHRCLADGGKILLFGNGGSAADAQHLAAEFLGRFVRERVPLPALALAADTSTVTSIANDYGFEQVFARQILALGSPGDVGVAISTSGRSPNVVAAARAARDAGLTTVALTGGNGGELASITDITIIVPSEIPARIQECHIAIGHAICEVVEVLLFGSERPQT